MCQVYSTKEKAKGNITINLSSFFEVVIGIDHTKMFDEHKNDMK
jgi:hypothetical protein